MTFYESDDVEITADRILYKGKVILLQSIVSFEINEPEVKPPYLLIFIGSVVALLTESFWIAITIALLISVVWYYQHDSNEESLLIELSSGSTVVLMGSKGDLQKQYDALYELIRRGPE